MYAEAGKGYPRGLAQPPGGPQPQMSGHAAPRFQGRFRVGAGAAGRLIVAVLAGAAIASISGLMPRLGTPGPTSGVAAATATAPATIAPWLAVQDPDAYPEPRATFAVLPATVTQTATLPPAPPDPLRRLRVPVLNFHRVLPHPDPAAPDYELSTSQFSAIINGLASAGWHTITAQELAWDLSAGTPPPARTYVVTVDDGTDDGATDVLPALRHVGAVGTFYVIAGRVGTPGYLTWDQLRAMRAEGMEIGNHTTSHPHLPDLALDDEVNEILTCQVAIASQLGARSTTLAYPYGAFNDSTVRAARMSGIVAAFTTAEGHFATWADRLSIPRINVGASWTPSKLLALLEGYVREPTPAPTRR